MPASLEPPAAPRDASAERRADPRRREETARDADVDIAEVMQLAESSHSTHVASVMA